ncbi:HNH endonuclease [Cytobacillus sp. FSL W8-0315]|uniref:HNH endonuclease n=1 Tax=Cytobacillus sp. FSL W8-0315 TaxID=2921600 RepID=UPI0030F77A26
MRFKYDELSQAILIVNSIYEGGSKGSPPADDPLTKIFKVDGFLRSVGNRSGFRKSMKEKNGKSTKDVAFAVIYSTGKVKEWPDFYDKKNQTFTYYGDNREPGNHYLNTKQRGNLLLKDLFEKAASKSPEIRRTIPPIFVFESTGIASNVEFLGLAVPGVKGTAVDQSLELVTVGEEGSQFQNYRATFTMVEIELEGISRKWLAELKDYNGDTFRYAPKEWVKFVEEGLNSVSVMDGNSGEQTTLPDVNGFSPSEKQYLLKTRLTQGKFRETLLKRTKVCKLCGVDNMNLLVASHIKPWSHSDDRERINFYNGILLCPSHDAAFDKGLISFNSNGNIVISSLLSQENQKLLNVNPDMKIELEPNHKKFMDWHLSKVFVTE